MKLIWLSGFAGSGKDTLASILVKKHDYYRVAFADYLKDYVSDLYGFERSLCDTVEGKKTIICNDKTVRDLLIEESAEAKKLNEDVFAEQVIENIFRMKQEKVVISDWRYPHEYHYIKGMLEDAEHITIRITRPGLPSLPIPSEHALDTWNFDHTVTNSDLRVLEKDVLTYIS